MTVPGALQFEPTQVIYEIGSDIDEELLDIVDRQEALLDRLDILDEKSQEG